MVMFGFFDECVEKLFVFVENIVGDDNKKILGDYIYLLIMFYVFEIFFYDGGIDIFECFWCIV